MKREDIDKAVELIEEDFSMGFISRKELICQSAHARGYENPLWWLAWAILCIIPSFLYEL